MLRSKFSHYFQNAPADLSLCCGHMSFCCFCGITNPPPPGTNRITIIKAILDFPAISLKDKVDVEVQMFPPFSECSGWSKSSLWAHVILLVQMFPPFAAAGVLENNRQAHYVKCHALCHHPRWPTRCCVIQHGGPDMMSYNMADRIWGHPKIADRMCRHPKWPTGYEVIQNSRPDVTSSKIADRMWRQKAKNCLGT